VAPRLPSAVGCRPKFAACYQSAPASASAQPPRAGPPPDAAQRGL